MRVVLRWPNPPAWVGPLFAPAGAIPTPTREARRERFFQRLQRVRYYADRDPHPPTPLRDFLEYRTAFLGNAPPGSSFPFRSPLDSPAITVLGVPVAPRRGLRVQTAAQWPRLHLSPVRLLAATPPVLRQVVAAAESSLLAMPKLGDAIVVLNTAEQGLLFPGERDMIWRCFGLPIFEQWLGLDGELLAWECGAHQGIHLRSEMLDLEQKDDRLIVTSFLARRYLTLRLDTGWQADLDARPCVCGHPSPRLRNLQRATLSDVPRHAVA